MQVDPITLNLKPPGSELLKSKCDDPLSNFAFKCNLRRYSLVNALAASGEQWKNTVAQLNIDIGLLVGDCLFAAAFVTYSGQGLQLVHFQLNLSRV